MKKLTLVAIVIIAGVFTFYSLLDSEEVNDDGLEKDEETEIIETDKETKVIENSEGSGEKEPINMEVSSAEEVEAEFPFEMTESNVRIAIHHMSHQKVQASQK